MTTGELNFIFVIVIFVQLAFILFWIKLLKRKGKNKYTISLSILPIVLLLPFIFLVWFASWNSLKAFEYSLSKDYNSSLLHYEKSLLFKPFANSWFDTFRVIKKDEILTAMGEIYYEKGSYIDAVNYFERALTSSIQKFKIYVYLAKINFRLGNFGESNKYHEKIANFKNGGSNDLFYLINRGESYSVLKKYDEAISEFKKALELSPNKEIIHYYLATCYSMKSDIDNALFHLKFIDCNKPDYKSLISSDDFFLKNLRNHSDFNRWLLECN